LEEVTEGRSLAYEAVGLFEMIVSDRRQAAEHEELDLLQAIASGDAIELVLDLTAVVFGRLALVVIWLEESSVKLAEAFALNLDELQQLEQLIRDVINIPQLRQGSALVELEEELNDGELMYLPTFD